MTRPGGPPRLAEALLRTFLPPGGVRESVLGDLHEMHAARVGASRMGRLGGHMWYWSHALYISAGYAWRSVRGERAPDFGRRGVRTGPGGPVLGDLARDARLAVRSLLRTPGFLAVAVLTLALGVGANTAVFSVVNGVYLRPLPYEGADRLVFGGQRTPGSTSRLSTMTGGTWSDWAAGQTAFSSFAGYRYWTTTVERDGVASRTLSIHSLGSLFDVLGASPLMGRTFTASEEGPGKENLVVLSHAFWQRAFGDTDPVGGTLTLDGEPHEIIGVMPRTFRFPSQAAELWTTSDMSAEALADRDDHFINVVARLAPGRTVEQALRELEGIHAGIRQAHPGKIGDTEPDLLPMRDVMLQDAGTLWIVLLGAVALVLLIACVNLTNLLLSRAGARRAEMALRRALGASRGRLARMALTESGVVAVGGGAVGLLVGWLFLRGVLAWMPGGVPRTEAVGIDGSVLAFTFGVSALAALLVGAAPALKISDEGVGRGIRAARGGPDRVRRGLVTIEIALSVVLVTAAGLTIRGFAALRGLDPGFATDGRQVVSVELPGDVGDDDRNRFYRDLVSLVEGAAGVRSAGVGSVYPMSGFTPGSWVGFPGDPVDGVSDRPTVRYVGVSPGYRAAAGIPLVRGRDLTPEDGPGGVRALLLSETAAALLFPGREALGERISLGPDGVVAPLSAVVGVVGDVRQRGMVEDAPPIAYVPRESIPFWRGYGLVVETDLSGAALSEEVRTLVEGLDPRAVSFEARSPASLVAAATQGGRNVMFLFALLAAVALVMAGVGVFGVAAFSVGQRTREIGIRMALGARSGDVQRTVVRGSLGPIGVGAACGLILAILLSGSMESLVSGVEPTDPMTLAAVPLLLTLVGAAASWLPVRRAVRSDPTRHLAGE